MAPRAACARPSAGAPTRERARPGVLAARLGPWALPAVISENKVSGACPALSHTNVTMEQEALLELGHVRKTRDYFLLWIYGGWGGLRAEGASILLRADGQQFLLHFPPPTPTCSSGAL